MVALRDVHAGYGAIEVLHGLDLTVPDASVVALLGPNGAGKTTTVRAISGLLPVTSGSVRLGGRDLTTASAHDRARLGVCAVPEGRGVFPNLTVRENLWLTTYAGGDRKRAEDIAFSRFPRLGERRGQLAGTLSGGEQQMLALARALVTDPAVILLDELSMGLAPTVVRQLYDLVGEIADGGVAILLVEQFAQAALAIADQAVVLVDGRMAAAGKPNDIAGQLSAAYLGGGAS